MILERHNTIHQIYSTTEKYFEHDTKLWQFEEAKILNLFMTTSNDEVFSDDLHRFMEIL